MSYKDNADFRSRSAGGYAFAENFLWDIFLPLIESDGASVYLALTRLIPRAAIDADRQVTLRAIEEASGVSKTQAARKRDELLALGMITERTYGNRRASTFQLYSLVDLYALGRAEILRRLVKVIGVEEMKKRLLKRGRFDTQQYKADLAILEGLTVPPGDTDTSSPDAESPVGGGASTPESGVEGREGEAYTDNPTPPPAAAPEGTGGSAGPRWDSESKFLPESAADETVSQKRASVSQKRASVSHTEASVSQKSVPFNTKEVEVEVEKDLTPLPPVPGEERDVGPILAFTDCRFGDAGFALSLGHAARWVMREAGLVPATRGAAKRIETAICGALTHGTRQSRQPLDEVARIALGNYRDFQADIPLMRFAWGPEKFFSQGYWAKPSTWPYDPAKRNARIGT